MSQRTLVLATDLDGTFAAGTSAAMSALHAALKAAAATLIYCTGRSVESARMLVRESNLPVPRVLIADVGTSVLEGLGPGRMESIEQDIGRHWPGTRAIHERLGRIPGLEPQAIDAPLRASYWIVDNRARRLGTGTYADFEARPPSDPSLSEAAEHVAFSVATRAVAALHALDVDVVISGNVYLDVLPPGVNKGTTLLRVLARLGIPPARCIVAGDSLNDRSLFEIGAPGIIVGNCEPALRAAVGERSDIYCAQEAGAAGIMEGLRHFGMLDLPRLESQGHAHGE